MRDPERIPEILALLAEVWPHYPDQRLGQLVLNACRGRTAAWPDVFNVEDDVMLEGLRSLLPGEPWTLYRAGEDGNPFAVERFTSKQAADDARARYEARGHKQHYWIARDEND